MASNSTPVKKTFKPNQGNKTFKPNNKISLADFQREVDPITSDKISQLVAKTIKELGAPDEVVHDYMDYLLQTSTTAKAVVEAASTDEADEVLAQMADQTKARTAGGAVNDESPQTRFTPHKMSEVLLIVIMTVNRLFNQDEYKTQLPEEFQEIFDEFRRRLYTADYAFQIPVDYGLPAEFMENLARCGLGPKRLFMVAYDLNMFLEAHLAALASIGVVIELNREAIALASKCESISVAINFSKLISTEQRQNLRAAFALALTSIKNTFPEGLKFLPASVLGLLSENFPNIYAMVCAVNTSQKETRMDNFKRFASTEFFHELSMGADIEAHQDNLDDIFSMLIKFVLILHMLSINFNRKFSNQCLQVTTPNGKKITLVFPRLPREFFSLLADGIDHTGLNTVLSCTKNPSMLYLSFVSSMVASVLVACYVNPHKDALPMLTKLQTLFERFDQNTARINDTKKQKGNPVPLFETGNELVSQIFTVVQDMYEATRLNEVITPREVALFDAFFKGVNAVKPGQPDVAPEPRARVATGLDAFDAPVDVQPRQRPVPAAAPPADNSFPPLGAAASRPTTPLAGQWGGGAKPAPYKPVVKTNPAAAAAAPPRRHGFTRGTAVGGDDDDHEDDGWH